MGYAMTQYIRTDIKLSGRCLREILLKKKRSKSFKLLTLLTHASYAPLSMSKLNYRTYFAVLCRDRTKQAVFNYN